MSILSPFPTPHGAARGFFNSLLAKQLVSAYYSSFEDGYYSSSKDSRYVSDIKFSVISNDARIQIHGCNTARESAPGDSLAELLSKELFDSGRKNAYVIGHIDKSNPNIDGERTNIYQQDYRHGKRAIFHSGTLVKEVNKKGVVEQSYVRSIIKEKKQTMKKVIYLMLPLLILVLVPAILLNLKDKAIVVEANFTMLACENCMHMNVINSSSRRYVGETIIPLAETVDVALILSDIVSSKSHICLLGRPYRYNPNLLGIEADDVRFDLIEVFPLKNVGRNLAGTPDKEVESVASNVGAVRDISTA